MFTTIIFKEHITCRSGSLTELVFETAQMGNTLKLPELLWNMTVGERSVAPEFLSQ